MNIVSSLYVSKATSKPEIPSEKVKYAPLSGLRNNQLERQALTDEFVSTNTPTFTSAPENMVYLRKYAKELGNAYSDARFISDETYNYIMGRIRNTKSDAKAFSLVNKYSPIFDEVEAKVCKFFKHAFQQNNKATIKEIIDKQLPTSYANLAPEYNRVITELQTITPLLPNTSLKKRYQSTLEQWSSDLHNKNYESAMSVRYEQILSKMKFPKALKEQKEAVLETLKHLPQQEEDLDAFIVRYKDANKRVLFKRILLPFVVNLEHVKPRSKGGHASSISNIVLVRRKDNDKRAANDLMEDHPEREFSIRAYFNNVIDTINRGGMKKIPWYPFEIKKTLETESHNKICLDKELARLKISEEEAYKNFIK